MISEIIGKTPMLAENQCQSIYYQMYPDQLDDTIPRALHETSEYNFA